MATENIPVFNKYEGNGTATEFSIGFPYLDTSFVKVYIKRAGENEEKLDSNRFSFVNDTTIKFPVLETDTVLQEGEVITIQRETILGSEYEFDNQVRLFPEEVMNADDLSFQQIQELARDLERAVKVKPTDEQTSEELIDEVYYSLKTATETAAKAIESANQAQAAADKATEAANQAELQINETVANAVEDVRREALDATNEVIDQAADTVTQIAKSDIDTYVTDTINPLVSNAEADAENAAESAELASNEADEAKHWAEDSRVWATGEDAEIEEIAPNQYEHSSRGYADLAMAIANTPEDVPVEASNLLALEVIKGPKGDSGEAEFAGDVSFTGTFDVHSDSNHPVKITGMAGTSATGYQIVDSNGLGDSDFEHYATGDRYGTRITNHNNTSDTSVSIDLYQSNIGKSVLDLTDVDTVLIPTPSVTDNTQRPATTEWVNNAMADVSKISADETITGAKTFAQTVDSKGFYISRTETPYTETPSTTIEKGIVVRDEGNTNIASLLSIQYASGTNRVQMQVRGKAGTSRIMYVQEATDGKVTYNYGQTVGSQWIKMPKGAGTAVLICWGNISAADMAATKTVTYPTAFSETPRIATTSNGGSAQVYQNVIKDGSATSFTVISSGGAASQGFHWIAVGNAAL